MQIMNKIIIEKTFINSNWLTLLRKKKSFKFILLKSASKVITVHKMLNPTEIFFLEFRPTNCEILYADPS